MARRAWEGWDDADFADHPLIEGLVLGDDDEHEGLRAPDVSVGEDGAVDVSLTSAVVGGRGLVASRLARLRLEESLVADADLAGIAWPSASLRLVELRGARLAGADLTEARLWQVRFRDCPLDAALFSDAVLEGVRFERCSLRDAWLGGAQLSRVSFVGCDLSGLELSGATFDEVDLRSSDLGEVRDIAALRGATVDAAQLAALAAPLAARAGLTVAEDLDLDPSASAP